MHQIHIILFMYVSTTNLGREKKKPKHKDLRKINIKCLKVRDLKTITNL